MSALTYRITTLGCRVNHAETREMESVLRDRGLRPAASGERADLEVLHTCSVTTAAAAKSRHAVRRARRRQQQAPDAGPVRDERHRSLLAAPPEVVVTGCYAATNPDEAAAISGDERRVLAHEADDGSPVAVRLGRHVDEWLGRTSLPSIRPSTEVSSFRRRDANPEAPPKAPPEAPPQDPPTRRVLPLPVITPAKVPGAHVRAELRIQDGCDAHCTFCIIPRIRRTLRSKPVIDAVEEARHLVALGHRELVLSGIFLGAYGHETALRRRQERPRAEPLAELLDAVAQVPGLERLRLSSLEPGDVGEALLDAMVANAPVVVPHLHLPLQSGSDRVLRMMNRQYGIGDYLEMIDKVNAHLTDTEGVVPLPPAVTTDVICGFPGEREADFERTLAVAERVGFLHMHVFPYSAREGTAAARWRERFVPDAERKRRVRTLIELETDPTDGLSMRYRRRLADRRVRVILEQPDRERPGVMTGRCDHYALVHVPTTLPRGRMVHVDITGVTPDRTEGTIPLAPPPLGLPVLPRSFAGTGDPRWERDADDVTPAARYPDGQ